MTTADNRKYHNLTYTPKTKILTKLSQEAQTEQQGARRQSSLYKAEPDYQNAPGVRGSGQKEEMEIEQRKSMKQE